MTFYTFKAKAKAAAQPGQSVQFEAGKGYYVTGVPRVQNILIRQKLVTIEEAAAKLGIKESGGNNHGPWVKKFLAEVGLPEGYPWCAAFQSYEIDQAVGHKVPIESASVLSFYDYAKSQGWLVDRPLRGDLACYDLDGNGSFNDHIELVDAVLGIGSTYTLRTIGGNTGDGSVADGDGVFEKTRVIAKSRVAFIRIPGSVKA